MTEENQEQDGEDTGSGREYVELNEAQQARFNRLYAHMKEYEGIAQQSRKDLETAFGRIEELEKGNQRSNLDSLRDEEKTHLEAGEFDKAAEVRDKITDIKVESAKPKEVQKEPDPQQVVEPDWMTPDVKKAIVDWGTETDEGGNYLRPWANENHPSFAKFSRAAEMVLADPDFKSTTEMLAEIDRVMGAKPKATRQSATVLSGDGGKPNGKAPKLNDDQKKIAAAMNVTPENYAKMIGIGNAASAE